jgi:hypothetical protein
LPAAEPRGCHRFSSDSPATTRRISIRRTDAWTPSPSSARSCLLISVRTRPGSTANTRTPRSLFSASITLLICSTAAFVVE